MQSLVVALPKSLGEQRAIAAALSDVDGLLAKLDQLIAKKRDLKQAAMQQLLTGQTRLPGFSGEWEVKRLGDVLRVRHGKSQHHIIANDGQYPILATGGEIGRTNTCLYDKPSVLIGRKGTIDKPQYRNDPFWTVDTLFYTEIFSGISAKFIFYKFNMINWRSYNEASGVPSLNASTIENIEIKLPKSKEQTAIATVLSDMDAEIAALVARRDKTRALKQGMMQELLTGRIRLV
jgi:type I restriction enzyme S subunit